MSSSAVAQLRASSRVSRLPVGPQRAAAALEADLDADEIRCSRCADGKCDSDDIVLCDFPPCGMALHTQCCDPPLDAPPAEGDDSDWFCGRCTCMFAALVAANKALGQNAVYWDDLFSTARADVRRLQKNRSGRRAAARSGLGDKSRSS